MARRKKGTLPDSSLKPKSPARVSKKAKIQARIKSLENKLQQAHKSARYWADKAEKHYEECSKKGIYNAVTYGIIKDFSYVDKLKDPAKKQLALKHIILHEAILRKRDPYHKKIYAYTSEIYKLKQELKKL